MVQWLTLKGHHAFGLTGGADVPGWVKNYECDVVVLDAFLPDANGISLIGEVLRVAPGARVFVVSGTNDPALQQRALMEGANQFFCKPIDFAKLTRALEIS